MFLKRTTQRFLSMAAAAVMVVSAVPDAYAAEDINFNDYASRYIIKAKDYTPINIESAFQKAGDRALENIEISEFAKQGNAEAANVIFETQDTKAAEEGIIEVDSISENDNILLVTLPAAVSSEEFSKNVMQENAGDIEYIQPDYKMSLASYDISVEDIKDYELQTEDSQVAEREVIAAVLDTGVDISHSDFDGKIIKAYDFTQDSELPQAPKGSMEYAHGTHVAGVIANGAENVRIMPLRVFENAKAYTSDIIRAINYAEENGAEIVNCSWGSGEYNRALAETIEKSNMLFVCAAGNGRQNLDESPVYPACFEYDNVICAASVNDDYGMSYFSNFGPKYTDIAAKGKNIPGAALDGGYTKMSGTSVSAALVTAAAALTCENSPEAKKEAVLFAADTVSCLDDAVFGAKALNTDNIKQKCSGSRIDANPEEEFYVRAKKRTQKENWELFSEFGVADIAGDNIVLKTDGTLWKLSDDNTIEQIAENAVAVHSSYKALAYIDNHGKVVEYNESTGIFSEVTGLDDVKALTGGNDYFIALRSDGTVWGWGENHYGQTGYDSYYPEVDMYGDNYDTPWQVGEIDNAVSVSAGGTVSLAVDETGKLWQWGELIGGRPKQFASNISETAVMERVAYVYTQTDGKNVLSRMCGIDSDYPTGDFELTYSDGCTFFYDNMACDADGNVYTIEYDGSSMVMNKKQNLSGIVKLTGTRESGLALDKNDSVYRWNSGIESAENVIDSGSDDDSFGEEYIINEQYSDTNNSAYHKNQSDLGKIGWSEVVINKGDQNILTNPSNGEFTAESGKLVIKKTSERVSGDTEGQKLIYAVEKRFIRRQDNWKGDDRVSVWTNNFKGDYTIALRGAFKHNYSQAYYDIIGVSNGVKRGIGRYRIDGFDDGNFSVVNCMLNKNGCFLYPLWSNPRGVRTIRTKLSSQKAEFQTFLDKSPEAVKTTVDGAQPDDTFNMTDWDRVPEGAYLTGIRIYAQNQAVKNDVIAEIESLQLIEHSAVYDRVVENAVEALSMDALTSSPECVTHNLRPLPEKLYGADITWTSDKPEYMTNSGEIVKQATVDTDVIMTAKITNPADGFTKYMDFRLTLVNPNGFYDVFDTAVTGAESDENGGGTTAFAEYPEWSFAYPGVKNAPEVHKAKVMTQDGYLVFEKISDRQTANYQPCVEAYRSLGGFRGESELEFTARANGTGTFRIGMIGRSGVMPFSIMLDASQKRVDVAYGENGNEVRQSITTVNPLGDHNYKIVTDTDGSFVLYIDNKVIKTESGSEVRSFIPGNYSNFQLSKLKLWITNITMKNTKAGYIKNIKFTPVSLKSTDGVYSSFRAAVNEPEGEELIVYIRAVNMSAETDRIINVTYSPEQLRFEKEYTENHLTAGTLIESEQPGSIKLKVSIDSDKKSVSGILSLLKFTSLADGEKEITGRVENQ